MGLLWDRSAAVTLGPKIGQRTKINNLRIAFEIEKTSENNANTAKISIYNMSQKTWNDFITATDRVILLEAGYGNNLDTLFYGDVPQKAKCSYLYSGTDTIAMIEPGDGLLSLIDGKLEKSYEENFSIKLIIKDVLKSFQDAGGVVIEKALEYIKSGNVPDKKAQAGFVASGSAKTIMDKFMSSLGLEWSIQDNEVQIIPINGNTEEEVIFLTPQTGLIGSPIKREEGLEFTALIQTKIKPGQLVLIESRDINGTYRVRKAKFIGDTHDQPWYVTAEAKEKAS